MALADQLSARLGVDSAEFLGSVEFVEMCERRFRALDTQGSGSLRPEELAPIIQSLLRVGRSEQDGEALTMEECTAYANLWDKDGNGSLSRDEFTSFVRFASLLRLLENLKVEKDKELLEDTPHLKAEVEIQVRQPGESIRSVLDRLEADNTLIDKFIRLDAPLKVASVPTLSCH